MCTIIQLGYVSNTSRGKQRGERKSRLQRRRNQKTAPKIQFQRKEYRNFAFSSL